MQVVRTASTFALLVATMLIASSPALEAQVAEITVTSSSFEHNQPIPLRNSAYGDNLSPALSWSGAPEGTSSFALVLADESVPMPGGFVHWVIYNIPGNAMGLPEGIPSAAATVTEPAGIAGTLQGRMGMNNPGYFGPRPPAGNPPHNYVFTVYAIGPDIDFAEGLNRNELMQAIEGHIVGQGSITGTYQNTN